MGNIIFLLIPITPSLLVYPRERTLTRVCVLQIVESALRVLIAKMEIVRRVAQDLPGGRI